jgi:hypothetical protein
MNLANNKMLAIKKAIEVFSIAFFCKFVEKLNNNDNTIAIYR